MHSLQVFEVLHPSDYLLDISQLMRPGDTIVLVLQTQAYCRAVSGGWHLHVTARGGDMGAIVGIQQ